MAAPEFCTLKKKDLYWKMIFDKSIRLLKLRHIPAYTAPVAFLLIFDTDLPS